MSENLDRLRAEADEALAHNIADVLENGPRLAWGRKTAAVAIDRQNRRVLKTGFGALGVGTMWVDYDEEPAEWADLPEQIEVKAMTCHVTMTREQIEDSTFLPPGVSLFEYLAEQERQFNALPPEEQARILAEQEAERAAAKAARTCPHCGCDPDEHGDYY